jgi:GT2 family glycosyltransferase
MPFLSVIIPTCHRNQELDRCLRALIQKDHGLVMGPVARSLQVTGQPEFDYEIIVTDDGSISTAEAMLQQAFPFVRWIQGPKCGPAANRNHGAKNAKGDWLLFLDDDCVPDPGWMEAYRLACSTTDCGVLEGKTVPMGERTRADQVCPVNEMGGVLWSCNFAIRRDLFLQVGGFDESYPSPSMEDLDLTVRLQRSGHRIQFLPEGLIVHPWRPRHGLKFVRLQAKSIVYFVCKHPEAGTMFPRTWGLTMGTRSLIKHFPLHLVRFGAKGSFRGLGLDLVLAYSVAWPLLTRHQHRNENGLTIAKSKCTLQSASTLELRKQSRRTGNMHSVEVIIPVYNEPLDSILVTVNSLNSQGFKIDRILLVDDGSTHPPDFDRLITVSQIPVSVLRMSRNSGISAARNYAARHSNADFLLFVNSDIELVPDWVEKTVNFLADHPEAGLASGKVSSIQTGLIANWRQCFLENTETWIDQTHEIGWAMGHAVIIAAGHLWRVGGWNEAMKRAYEDIDLSKRLRAVGLRPYQVRGALSVCHDRYTIRDLAAKTLRNRGWSLDPSYPGDGSTRPFNMFVMLIHFLVIGLRRMNNNLTALRLKLLPIDLAVVCCGVCLILKSGLRQLQVKLLSALPVPILTETAAAGTKDWSRRPRD